MSDSLSGSLTRSPPSHPESTATIPLSKPTMLGRRRSSSFPAMDAQYRALPQSPDVAQDIRIPSAIEEGEVAVDDIDDSILDGHPSSNAPVDSRIMWVNFMLGAAVLLPWNGASEAPLVLSCEELIYKHLVMITAEPYFLSQLRHSSMRSTFASYLVTAFTLSNFFCLAHATVTSKKVCLPLPCARVFLIRLMNGIGTRCPTDAMVDAMPRFTHMSPHTEHLRPPLRGHPCHIHHRDSHRASLLRRISSDVRSSRGISLRPHGHPVIDIRPSGGGGHPLCCPAHQRNRLVAHIPSGSSGPRRGRCGDQVRKAVLWDLDVVSIRVWSCERLDDAATLVQGGCSRR